MNRYLIESLNFSFQEVITIDCSTLESDAEEVEVISPSKIHYCQKCELNFQSSKKLKLHQEDNRCTPSDQ